MKLIRLARTSRCNFRRSSHARVHQGRILGAVSRGEPLCALARRLCGRMLGLSVFVSLFLFVVTLHLRVHAGRRGQDRLAQGSLDGRNGEGRSADVCSRGCKKP